MLNLIPLALMLALVLAFSAGPSPVDSLIEGGHWKRARTLAESEYKANPKNPAAVLRLARVRQAFGNLDEAARLAQQAAALDPKSSSAQRVLGDIYCDQAEKASLLSQLGLARKCKAALEAAVALDPKDSLSVEHLIMYLVQAPSIVGGDRKRANDLADGIVKRDPAQGYITLAEIAGKDKADSSGFYRKAVEADPRNYAARVSLAFWYAGPGHDPAEAEKHLRAAIESNPDRVRAWRALAALLASQNRIDETATLLAAAQSAVPDDLCPWFAAANNLMTHSIDLPRAELWIRKYLAETREPEVDAPPLASAHRVLALIYEKQGSKAEAIGELQTALRLKPDFDAAKQDLKRMR
jgi:tetratricopeptide (TPR) repeat protein